MNLPSGLTPLIQVTRGGHLENLHLGAIAHVNAQGRVLNAVGNPHWHSFTRSTLKPLQALPFVNGGGLKLFDFSTRQTALLCASHNGEDAHAEQVDGMLNATGLTHKALRCGCHMPLRYSYGGQIQPATVAFDERHNNCSGKHAGMLAYCVQNGLPLDTYLAADHPLQQAIRASVARVCSVSEDSLTRGIDGCSAPNYGMPLSALATAFARMADACAGRIAHADAQASADSLATLGRAMTSQPHMVSGDGRNDLSFMTVGRGDWITKVGADGVQVVASISRGEGFAIKVIDATMAALHATTVHVLSKLGWLDDAQHQALDVWRATRITNASGIAVGAREAVFKLKAA